VWAAVRGIQCAAGCILPQEDVCRILKALVHERSRRGVARAGTGLRGCICQRSRWMRCVGFTVLVVGVSSTPETRRGFGHIRTSLGTLVDRP
jgi:hypothetical protein